MFKTLVLMAAVTACVMSLHTHQEDPPKTPPRFICHGLLESVVPKAGPWCDYTQLTIGLQLKEECKVMFREISKGCLTPAQGIFQGSEANVEGDHVPISPVF